ncbi:MAG: hypothetical protein QOK04_2880, partial [Solirubrobacteraceae bacterium]|nr:hypothetical protein [Solirubrobacteraceae bacterium]
MNDTPGAGRRNRRDRSAGERAGAASHRLGSAWRAL